ncbi:MAG: hypothetical protein ACOYEV_08095 [Candidatus Nanopelagicales bacterium]
MPTPGATMLPTAEPTIGNTVLPTLLSTPPIALPIPERRVSTGSTGAA